MACRREHHIEQGDATSEGWLTPGLDAASVGRPLQDVRSHSLAGMRAITLISKSKPASQLTPIAVQFG